MTKKSRLEISIPGPREAVIDQVTAALEEEGFGVLTRIDIDEAFQQKLGTDFRPYTILGACNPGLAYQALTARPDAGLLLPCNVVVDEESDRQSKVRILDPITMFQAPGFENDEAMVDLATDARERLVRVADQLATD